MTLTALKSTLHSTKIPQLRVAVTSRCDRRCSYCRPAGEAASYCSGMSLTTADVVAAVRCYYEMGGRDIKLTGGDPALWTPLIECISAIRSFCDIDIQVLSRSPMIGSLAKAIADAGANELNISLDTLDPVTHRKITGVDDLPELLVAIGRCVASGVPCKINTVVMAGVNEDDISRMVRFCERTGVSSLKLLDVIEDLHSEDPGNSKWLADLDVNHLDDLYTSMTGIAKYLEQAAVKVRTVSQGGLGHPMQAYTLPSGLEVVIKDHTAGAWYARACSSCSHYPCHDALMALRLTADKTLQYCLLRNDIGTQLPEDIQGNYTALRQAMADAFHLFSEASFYRVG